MSRIMCLLDVVYSKRLLVSLDYLSTCSRERSHSCAHAQHNSVDAEILYLAASWIREEYKFILIVLIKRKYPFSQLRGKANNDITVC